MNIIEFKKNATITEDNREKAASNWAKSWGFDFWFNLWGYRTYVYGRFKYKSGHVNMRHYGYTKTECYIDNNPVSLYRFKKELANEPCPPQTQSKPNATQLEIGFR